MTLIRVIRTVLILVNWTICVILYPIILGIAYVALGVGSVIWAISEIIRDNVKKAWEMSQNKMNYGRQLSDIALDKAWDDIW